MLLSFPILILYFSGTPAGSLALPSHVWTSARPVDGDADIVPDIAVRMAWVHGSYMKALDATVLEQASVIQSALLGLKPGCASPSLYAGLTSNAEPPAGHRSDDLVIFETLGSDWFYHSPLLYWNCSTEEILTDSNIIATVNERCGQVSPANISLRHTSVFAGKRFHGDELVAADALVISLFYKLNSKIGDIWTERAEELVRTNNSRWDIYPSDGKVTRSRLYDFRFQPMSLQDNLTLALAYGMMALYVAASLRRLRAVKSKFGLIVTVIAQVSKYPK